MILAMIHVKEELMKDPNVRTQVEECLKMDKIKNYPHLYDNSKPDQMDMQLDPTEDIQPIESNINLVINLIFGYQE